MRRLVLAVLTIAGTIGLAYGQAGVGKQYDTRDPFVCKSSKEPAKGAPSPSQAKNYVRCAAEKTAGCCIWLMENVQVEVGKSRPFSGYTDVGNEDKSTTLSRCTRFGVPLISIIVSPLVQPGAMFPRKARTARLQRRLPLLVFATKQLSATGAVRCTEPVRPLKESSQTCLPQNESDEVALAQSGRKLDSLYRNSHH